MRGKAAPRQPETEAAALNLGTAASSSCKRIMALTNAQRQRRHRERERAGKVSIQIDVDEVRLPAMLADPVTEGAFLDTDSPSREQLEDAVERYLEAAVTRYERDKYGTL